MFKLPDKNEWHQMLIGAFIWLVYLVAVHLLIDVGKYHHTLAELVCIPASLFGNYYLNTRFNFKVEHSPERAFNFLLITGFAWGSFLLMSAILVDVFTIDSWIAHYPSVLIAWLINLKLQRKVTFKDSNARSQA